MIANPLGAIMDCKQPNQLAKVMEELLKPFYPTANANNWAAWICQYDSIPKAKKCAAAFYLRKLGK